MKKKMDLPGRRTADFLLSGCAGNAGSEPSPEPPEKRLVWGDTTFNAENGEPDINPHRDNSGWACIRYGVGETLFRFSDSMEIEPWLAKSYENTDELTWVIQLREDVDFASGRHMDAQSVKECLEDLTLSMSGRRRTCKSGRSPRRVIL